MSELQPSHSHRKHFISWNKQQYPPFEIVYLLAVLKDATFLGPSWCSSLASHRARKSDLPSSDKGIWRTFEINILGWGQKSPPRSQESLATVVRMWNVHHRFMCLTYLLLFAGSAVGKDDGAFGESVLAGRSTAWERDFRFHSLVRLPVLCFFAADAGWSASLMVLLSCTRSETRPFLPSVAFVGAFITAAAKRPRKRSKGLNSTWQFTNRTYVTNGQQAVEPQHWCRGKITISLLYHSRGISVRAIYGVFWNN